MILLKIVTIIALISALTILASSTQQTFVVITGVGKGSIGATTGAGSVGQSAGGGSPTGGGGTGQSPDPHLFCKTGMITPICK
jgi:hypothetical protein